MIYQYHEIKTVHLEITEKCNANCPMCARTINGTKINPLINNYELSLDDCKKIFSTDFLKQLNHIYLCGNFGDPIAAQDTLDVLRYFREQNVNLYLSLNTNGSARNTEFWVELAKIIGKNGWIIFSIDGLEDTNHLYRVNTNFNKIIHNAKTFISAGGKARWEYIVFEHNEHQVEQAESLSKELGFESFQVKKSSRFLDEDIIGIKISKPKNEKYLNNAVTILNNLDFNSYLDTVSIDCKVSKEKNLYISAEGLVQPCCWVSGQIYSYKYPKYREQVETLINKIGKDNLNAKNNFIKDILDNEYFVLIEQSWTKSSCSDGKLGICAKTCGSVVDPFNEQYK